MTSVAPPPPPPPPPPSGSSAPSPNVTATITQLPPQMAKLPIDSLISGLIKAPTTQGEALLQTPQGPVSFKAPFVLPQGAQATFKLIQLQPQPQMQLTQFNAQPVPAQASAAKLGQLGLQLPPQNTAGMNQNTALNSAPQNSVQPTTPNIASGMKAWVLSQTPFGTPNQNSLQNPTTTQPGTLTTAPFAQAKPGSTVQNPFSNLSNQSGPQNPGTSGNPVAQNNLSGAQAKPTDNGARQMIQQGHQLSVRLLSAQPPGQPQSFSNPPSSNSTSTVIIQGQTQGMNAQGQPIVKLPQGSVVLDTLAKFPQNTSVRLEILSSHKPQAQGLNPALKAIAPHGMPDLSQSWPALEDTLNALKASHPALADHLSNTLIPKPDARLAANVFFFLKALGRGIPVKNWTDENIVKALGRTKPDVLAALEEDFANLSQKATQPNSTDWKIAYIPMQNEALHQIRLAHREPDEKDQDGKEDPGVRFVIDLDLSKLGPIQLDGLAKDKIKRFDLIFRTKSALPGHMRHDIHHIFEQGMAQIGFDGKITYQVTPHFIKVDGSEMSARKLNFGMIV